MKAELLLDCRCELGEGPLWHPGLKRLFWFDIADRTMFSTDAAGRRLERYRFQQPASAAAIIDERHLAVAMAGAILRLDLATGTSDVLVPLEADRPANRSNDGRVNPAGGFWIGTMSQRWKEQPHSGSLYQFKSGKLEKLLGDITVPNATCFSPDGSVAYFSDSLTKRIRQCALDRATGLPAGEWTDFIDTADHRGFPDGAVIDSEGFLWNARWGGSCLVRHAPDGSIDKVVELPVSRVTCPAFGGEDLKTLYITTAREGMSAGELMSEPFAGSIFALTLDVPGLPEPALRL